MQIVFENENFIVADKPSGWLTTPARVATDPRPCLGRELQARAGHPIFPVHRLDFEVSGLVIFAKTAIAHRVSQSWFEKLQIGKLYRATTVPGRECPREWVEWVSMLQRGKKRTFHAPHGQKSITRARVVESSKENWSWELSPVTGRPHQLRVELAHHGAPILGDVLYGGPPGQPGAIELRAVRLDLTGIAAEQRFGLPSTVDVSGESAGAR